MMVVLPSCVDVSQQPPPEQSIIQHPSSQQPSHSPPPCPPPPAPQIAPTHIAIPIQMNSKITNIQSAILHINPAINILHVENVYHHNPALNQ